MEKKKFNIIFLIIFITVLSLTIGYSAFDTSFYVRNTLVKVRPMKDIRVTKVSINGTSSSGVSNNEDFDKSKVIASISLPNSTSTITYQVTVKNFGNVPMGIGNITINNNNLDLQIANNTINSIVSELGGTKTFNVTIGYKSGVYSSLSSHTFENVLLNFNFLNCYNVLVEGIDNLTYTPYIIENGTYTTNLGSSINSANLIVKINDIKTTNYTFSNGVITIPNVTGDLVIQNIDVSNYDYAFDGSNGTISTPSISASTPITVANIMKEEYGGVNISDKVIYQIDVTITYSSDPGGQTQTASCQLNHDQATEQTFSFKPKSTNQTLTVSFKNLNIGLYDTFTIGFDESNSSLVSNKKVNITKMDIKVYMN